jgi:hypothetical protein
MISNSFKQSQIGILSKDEGKNERNLNQSAKKTFTNSFIASHLQYLRILMLFRLSKRCKFSIILNTDDA